MCVYAYMSRGAAAGPGAGQTVRLIVLDVPHVSGTILDFHAPCNNNDDSSNSNNKSNTSNNNNNTQQ